MDLKRLFMMANYTVVAFGAGGFFLASGDFLFVFVVANILLGGIFFGYFLPLYLEKRTSNFLIVSSFGLFLFYFMTDAIDFMILLSRFLVLVQLMRVFYFRKILYLSPGESPGPQAGEYYQIYFISLVEFAVAAITTADFLFALVFGAFLFVSPLILLIFNLEKERDHHSLPSLSIPFGSLMALTLLMGFLASLVVPIFFLAIPRIPQGFLGMGHHRKTQISGFSDQVDLNDIGYILENPQVVMRVKFIDPLPPSYPLLFKGSAYEIYENRQWKQRSAYHYAEIHQNVCNLYWRRKPPKGKKIRQEIYLSPLTTRTLFALHSPSKIQFIGKVNFRRLMVFHNGWVKVFYRPQKPLGYIVTSHYRDLSPKILQKARARGASHRYRSFPHSLSRKKWQKAALEITKAKKKFSSYEKILKIEKHFRQHYSYTLDLPEGRPGKDPVEEFFFRNKEGHCEFFASSMVFLLRSMGIPSRLVNGFRAGEYNPMGRYFLVRQKDAHAWVEVYFRDLGWVPFDPTPPRTKPAGSPLWAEMQLLVDYVQLKWMMNVIQYDSDSQRDLWRKTRELVSDLVLWFSRLLPSWREIRGWGYRQWILGAFFLFLIGWAGRFLLRLRHRRKFLQKTSSWILEGLLKGLSKKGYSMNPFETPLEFVDRLVARESQPVCLLEIVSLYYRGKFSIHPLKEEEEDRVRELLADLG